MTQFEARSEFAGRALSYVGTAEGSSLHQFLISTYNKIKPLPRAYELQLGDPWCAGFVTAIAALSNMLDIIPAECSCEFMIAGFQKMGRWHENEDYMPEIGDICFYDWQDSGTGDNKGEADHVGIVTKVHQDSFVVTEGNKNNMVGNRELTRNARNLRGFGLPDFQKWADAWNKANNTNKPSSWAAGAVAWAYENHLSDGKRLQQNMTREEAITLLYRYHLQFGGYEK